MLPKHLRRIFYKLHGSNKAMRLCADALAWSFMAVISLFKIKPPYDLTPLTIISHKYKFIYIGIPKTATRSFVNAFYHEGKDVYDSEMFETKKAYEQILKKYPDYFKFSFTRHPYDRILSCYNSKIGHHDLSLLKRARIMSFYKELKPGMSLEKFVDWLCNADEGRDKYADRHWMSQHKFLRNQDNTAITDMCGKYETLEKDLKTIMNKVDAPCPALKQKGWISNQNKHEDQISQNLKTKLATRYEIDFKVFDYET